MLYLGPLPPSVPIFSTTTSSSGLSLPAAATPLPSIPAPWITDTALPSLGSRGPYNPIALVSTRVAKKIMALEFVEMAEVVAEDAIVPTTRSSGSARPPVTSMSLWLERFSVMAAILAIRFPEKAPEFLAYQASIVRAERNYEGCQWVLYDRQYRREALARRDLDWSVPNTRLYNEAFTGRARVIPKCSYCLSDDHLVGTQERCRSGTDHTPQLHGLTPQSRVGISTRSSAGGETASTLMCA